MAYIARSDLDEYLSDESLIQLSDDDRTGDINDVVVSEAIAGAEAEVNGMLASRYEVPFSSPPELVIEICVVLTCYRLFLRRQRVPEDFQKLVDEKKDILMELAKGKLKLPDSDDIETDSGYGDAKIEGNTRLFKRSQMSGW